MRTFTRITFLFFAFLLLVIAAELIGFIPESTSWWETWLLRGAVITLGIGILLSGNRLRTITIQQQTQLETQVAQQTEELRIANQKLEEEIAHRRRAEQALARRAQEELSVSNARFLAIFHDAAVGIGIMGLDRRIIDANPAICRMFGRSREELIGVNAAEATFPDDNLESVRLHQQLVSGEKDSYEVDRRYVRKNGETFWTHVTMSSVRGPDGKPRYLVGMVIDIDERKKMQERIRESEARFRAMFDNTAVGMALMSIDRKVIQVNQAAERITGYPIAELSETDPSALAHPDDRLLDRELFEQLVGGKRDQYQIEKRYYRKDGILFWGRVTFTSVRDPDGQPQYIIGMIEDITEQREARRKLEAQEQEHRRKLEKRVRERTYKLADANLRLMEEMEQRQRIEETLALKAAEEAVSAERTRLARDLHDAVTQTLFSASLIAEVLPELWEMDIEEARHSTEELRQLTRGALAEMRTLLLELRPAALTQSRFEDLLKQLTEAVIGRARLPVKLTMDGQRRLPPEVQVALYRIAQESLNNIVKYARATQVEIHVILSSTGVYLEITDNGIGFDPGGIKPTSLGMRIMRERAEVINADFHVTSTPGKGTTVSITWNQLEIPQAESVATQTAEEKV